MVWPDANRAEVYGVVEGAVDEEGELQGRGRAAGGDDKHLLGGGGIWGHGHRERDGNRRYLSPPVWH